MSSEFRDGLRPFDAMPRTDAAERAFRDGDVDAASESTVYCSRVLQCGLLGTTVFISWANRDPDAKEYSDRLYACLAADGYEPLRDIDGVCPGEDWHKVIDGWLLGCDAAVIVFTPLAVKSDWVKKEVFVLMARHQVDPNFLVVPVCIGVDPATLADHGLGPSAVSAVQASRADGDLGPVLAVLEPLKAPRTVPEWEFGRRIRALEPIVADAPTFDVVLNALSETARAKWPRDDRTRRLVCALLHAEGPRWLQTVSLLARAELVAPDKLRATLDHLLTLRWVDARGAAPLSRREGAPIRAETFLLAADHLDFTAAEYRRRACLSVAEGRFLRGVVEPGETVDALATRLRQELANKLKCGDASLRGRLEGLAADGRAFLVALTLDAPTEEELQRLRAALPAVLLLVLAPALAENLLTSATLLLPFPEPGAVEAALWLQSDTHTDLEPAR